MLRNVINTVHEKNESSLSIFPTKKAMKYRRNLPILIALAGVPFSGLTYGQLFSDDFESFDAGDVLDTSGPWAVFNRTDADTIISDESTATPFGAPNQYFDFNDNSDTASVRYQSPEITGAPGAVTTFAFDFNEPSTGGDGNLIIGYAITGGDLNASGVRLKMDLNDGNVNGLTGGTSTYDLDTTYRIHLVFNDTEAAVDYNRGSNTVAAGTADVWIEPTSGPAVFAGNRASENTRTESYRVGLRSYSSNLQQVLIDNVTLFEGVVLPGNPPVLLETSPLDNQLTATVDTDLVATFNVPVSPGTGNILVNESIGGANVATLDVTGPQVTFSGTTVTVDLPDDLVVGTNYYVLIEEGAVTTSAGDPFGGIVAPDNSTWNFGVEIPALVAAQTSADAIRGRSQSRPLIYLSGSSSGQVGIGGPGGDRNDFNTILGFTLPTLPAGETLTAAEVNFEITRSRDTGSNPALHAYLIDAETAETTGVDFFYHGPADPNPNTEFVGSVNLVESGTGRNDWADDEQDQSLVLTGGALALLQSYYGGDHIPDRSEAFFRFNLDQLLGGANINNFERYFIDTAPDEASLSLFSGGTSSYSNWAAGFSPNPGLPTDNPDFDSLNNFLEFAFGTDPSLSDALPLAADGSVNGMPIALAGNGVGGVAFDFVFVRRDDFGTSVNLTYTPQFSSDLESFYDSSAIPALVADSAEDPNYEMVSVTYPFVLPNGERARYARVKVEITP